MTGKLLESIPEIAMKNAGDKVNNVLEPAPAPLSAPLGVLKETMSVVLLGVAYRVHRITHKGKKVQLRRIT